VSEFGPLFRFSFVHAPVSMVTIVARIRGNTIGKNSHCEKTHSLGSNNTKQNHFHFHNGSLLMVSSIVDKLWIHFIYLHAKVIFFFLIQAAIYSTAVKDLCKIRPL
jgi:hypothetical protein